MNAHLKQPQVFLDRALEPIRPWLDNDQVVEICANGPGIVWVEIFGQSAMQRCEVPELTSHALRHLSERVAGASGQSINELTPLLSAALPIRRAFSGRDRARRENRRRLRDPQAGHQGHEPRRLSQDGLVRQSPPRQRGRISDLDVELCELLDAGDIEAFISKAVINRYSICFPGGTSSGKTTFLNAILKEVPRDERIISIEDTRELKPAQENYLPLEASKGDQGESASPSKPFCRLRFAFAPTGFFSAKSGAPRPIRSCARSTPAIPARSPRSTPTPPAAPSSNSALMVMQAGLGLRKDEIISYIKAVLPIVIQQKRVGGWRGTSEIFFNRMAEWKRRNGRAGG